MTSAELFRALDKKEVPSLLFLYGEEGFLIEKCWRLILDILLPPADRDFNFDQFSARQARTEEILDQARTLPVFAGRRLVLVKDAQHFSADELELFLPYLRDPVPETVLVFVAEKIDGRRKFFQDFKKFGELVEFKKLYDNQIPGFIREQARQSRYSLTDEALALFCRRVGNDLQEIQGELTKLFAYLGDRPLADVDDVRTIVSDTRIDSVFALNDALGGRRHGDAQRLLGRILDDGSAPLMVLTMIVRHFRQLWKCRESLEQGTAERELPKLLGVAPFFIKGLLEQSRNFTSLRYRELFELFLETDFSLKSSGAHPNVLLTGLVTEITRGGK